MPSAMIARGTCTCGKLFVVFQPEKADMAQRLKESASDIDVLISDKTEAFCSDCGQAISLPVPEVLDQERHGMSSLFEWIESLENGTAKLESHPGQTSEDLPF